MALPATDTFTAADDTALTTYSANWTLNGGNFQINTNALASNADGANTLAHWNADAFADNQYSQITVVALGTSYDGVWAAVRCASAAHTGYTFEGYPTAVDYNQLWKYAAGVGTQIGSSGTVNVQVNDVLRIEANGTTITPLLNGVTTGTPGAQTDSSIDSGSAGVGGFGNATAGRSDNWEGGNLNAAARRIFVTHT